MLTGPASSFGIFKNISDILRSDFLIYFSVLWRTTDRFDLRIMLKVRSTQVIFFFMKPVF